MPARFHQPAMPGEVRGMTHSIGSEARTEILRVVSRSGGLPTAEVASRVGVSESAALRHLKVLAEQGVVEQVEVTGLGRAGIKLSWRVQPDRLEELITAWLRYVRGE